MALTKKRFIKTTGTPLKEVQQFDFSEGMDTETPDLEMKVGRLPLAKNARVFTPTSADSRVPITTRKGPGFYTVPIGEAASQDLSSGPKNPGTLVDDASNGTVTWTNPTNATSSDDVYATAANAAGSTSHFLKVTNFGFAIPTGATISGISVNIEAHGTVGGSTETSDKTVQLVKGGTITGTNKGTLTNYTTSDVVRGYGSSTDLWGITLTPADVNASTFGVAYQSTGGGTTSVDNINVTVYYNVASGSQITTLGTTNLVTNPSFEVNSTGWSTLGVGASIAVDATAFFVGTKSLKLTTAATGNQQAAYTISGLTIGQQYTIQGRVKATASLKNTYVQTSVDNYASFGSFTSTGGFDLLSLTITAANTSGTVEFGVFSNSDFIFIDAVMVQSGNVVNSYFDGSTTATAAFEYHWTGTANASTSTQSANQSIGLIAWQAATFTPAYSGRLTRVDLNLKTTTPAGTGPVIVEIRSNSAGSPGTVLATSSILSSSITSAAAYLTARFVEAPQVVSGTAYWIVAYIQDDGTNTYLWTSTTGATTAKSSANSGSTWSVTTYDLNYKTYISTDSAVLGASRYYRSTASPVTVFAHGTSLYSVNDNTGVTTAIKTGLTAATDYYFDYANDILFYVNGVDAPRQWDGTTEAASTPVTAISSVIKLHKNRLFYLRASDPARVDFSEAGDFVTATSSTNFLYIPTTKSTDPVVWMESIQDNLIFFTKRTKYVLYGADLTSFTLRQSTAVKGTIAPRTVKLHQNSLFFLSNDGVYQFNGATDIKISERSDGSGVTQIINLIADKTKCVAVVYNNQYRLYYPSAGSSVNDSCLVYEIAKQSWWQDTSVYVGRTFLLDRGSDSYKLVEGSSLVGALYYAEQDYNDLGKPITFEVRLPYMAMGQPAAYKRIKKYRPEFRSTSSNYGVDCQIDKDYSGSPVSSVQNLQGVGATWGSGLLWGGSTTWGRTILVRPKVSVSGKFYYVQYRYKRTGVNTPIEFLGQTTLFTQQRVK